MTRLAPLLPALLLAACGMTAAGKEPEKEAIVRPGDIPSGSLYRTSRPAPFDSMCRELALGDVVYLGEFHASPDHHAAQLQVIRQLHARGRLDAIGMEMFQRPFQKHLDDYVEGRIDEATMLERTEWKQRWGYDFGLYRPILEFAREHRIEVVALNVSTEIRRVVSKEGRDALSDEQRASLPEEDREFEGYADRFADLVRAHTPPPKADAETEEPAGEGGDGGKPDPAESENDEAHGKAPDPEMIERFLRIQILWDDVMADSIVRWMRRSPKNAQMAVIIGGGHVSHGWGVPARGRKRQGGLHKTLVMLTDGALKDDLLAQRYADFVWVMGTSDVGR